MTVGWNNLPPTSALLQVGFYMRVNRDSDRGFRFIFSKVYCGCRFADKGIRIQVG